MATDPLPMPCCQLQKYYTKGSEMSILPFAKEPTAMTSEQQELSTMQVILSQQPHHQSVEQRRGPIMPASVLFGGEGCDDAERPWRGRNRPEARPYAERMLRGTGVGMLFADLQREEKERQTRFDDLKTTERIKQDRKIRNYHHQNLEYIKLLQEAQKAQKKLDEQQEQTSAEPKSVPKQLKNISSKVAPLMKGPPTALATNGVEPLTLPTSAKRDAAIQTSKPPPAPRKRLPNDLPRQVRQANDSQNMRSVLNQGEQRRPRTTSAQPRRRASKSLGKDFVRMNMQIAATTPLRRPQSMSALERWDKNRHDMGAVPQYLEERKKQLAAMRGGNEQSETPPGHRLMPDDERKRTLDMLKLVEVDLLEKWNHMPVHNDTVTLQRRRNELRRQLEEVEDAIRVFQRPKVYVRVDQ